MKDLVKEYIEPASELKITHYQVCTDQSLHNVALFVAYDSEGTMFACQEQDDFFLPYNAYKKEILGYNLDVEHLKKTPQEQYYVVPTHKHELCSVLAMYKNQPK